MSVHWSFTLFDKMCAAAKKKHPEAPWRGIYVENPVYHHGGSLPTRPVTDRGKRRLPH